MKISSPITMAYPGPPRRAAGLARYLLLAVVIVSVLFYFRSAALSSPFRDNTTILNPFPSNPVPENPQIPQPPPENEGKPVQEGSAEERPAEYNPVGEVPAGPEKPMDEQPGEEKPAEEHKEEVHTNATIPAPAEAEPTKTTKPKVAQHPIDELIEKAEKNFEGLLKKETHDIINAAAVYRRRRGRHPPPGFDVWFKFAQDNNAVIVEDFFDQIYDDLGPFWGVEAKNMRREGWDFEQTINVRNGNATAGSDWFWTQIWLNMTKSIEHMLPDMDIALNPMDEPRVVAPWEHVNDMMNKERMTRNLAPPYQVIQEFQKLPPPGEGEREVGNRVLGWEKEKPYWKIASRGCPPESPARKHEIIENFSETPTISLAYTGPHSYKGFVSNFSLSTDFCHQPDLQTLHGMFIEPLSISTTQTMFAIFGGSKLHTNNEILLPPPMYWNNEERFTGGDDKGEPWHKKLNKVIWRGVATGGENKEDNWKGFQRHRFVAMTNSTNIKRAESWEHTPENWALPSNQYKLGAVQENRLAEWTDEWADTGFVDLNCSPGEPDGSCNYTRPYFDILPGMRMSDQFDRKFVPDIDGNSFSGRYRGFLMSTSLPLKATIFKEWHDSRLVPWKHFVPMDNRFMDFFGIMQYFLGYKGKHIKVEAHDKEAERIAMAGQEWANRVLRKEDMQIYLLRLLLEYARLSHDKREKLGWVKDIYAL